VKYDLGVLKKSLAADRRFYPTETFG